MFNKQNAPIVYNIMRAFPEVISFDCQGVGDITLRLYKDVSPEIKKRITEVARKYGFTNISIIVPMLTVKFYGNKELTVDEKQAIMQAFRNLAGVMHNCGIHVSETKLGFFPPEIKPLKQSNSL